MIPQGDFNGKVLGAFRFLNVVWRGKVFEGTTVKNKILGHLWIRGDVRTEGNTLIIRYPLLGLRDILIPCKEGWYGTMCLGPVLISFLLTKGEK